MSPSTAPAIRWQYYLGGTLGERDYLSADVNGDQTTDVVIVRPPRTQMQRSVTLGELQPVEA